MVRRRLIPVAVLALATLGATACTGAPPTGSTTTSSTTTRTSTSTSATTSTTHQAPAVTVLATHLDVPWDVSFLPDGSALMTLRDTAHVLRVSPAGATTDLGAVPGVVPDGEGGLLGITPSPAYATDHTVFVYFTAAQDNRIARATIEGDRITGVTPILTGIHKASFHNGGRIAFGPDGYLYAGVGDAGEGDVAQDRKALNGKILRINDRWQAGARQPVRQRGLVLRPPQRPRPRVGARRDDVRQRVRPEHLGRAQQDREGPQLRLAARRGTSRQPGIRRPARPVADR